MITLTLGPASDDLDNEVGLLRDELSLIVGRSMP